VSALFFLKGIFMKVEQTKDLGGGHLLEAGRATWDESQVSIRDRYPTCNGGFTPGSSSEIPMGDISELAVFAAEQNLLSQSELVNIHCAVSASLARRNGSA
jgi:hypothetical protein